MVGVAQLVRAPDCGSGGRGFETRHSPQFFQLSLGHYSVRKPAKLPTCIISRRECFWTWRETTHGMEAVRVVDLRALADKP